MLQTYIQNSLPSISNLTTKDHFFISKSLPSEHWQPVFMPKFENSESWEISYGRKGSTGLAGGQETKVNRLLLT
jgi:hypothetical protein